MVKIEWSKQLSHLALYCVICLVSCNVSASRPDIQSLEATIEQYSQSQPAAIVSAFTGVDPKTYSQLSSPLLIKASYASAVNAQVKLTLALTQLLLERAQQSNDSLLAGEAYYNRGAVYATAGQHDLSLDNLLLSLSSFESEGSERQIARVKGGLALMYVEISEYELANPYFAEAIESHKERNDLANLAKALQNRGFMKIQLNQLASAKSDIEQALLISENNNFAINFPVLYKNLARIEMLLAHFDQSLVYFEKALTLSQELKTIHVESEVYIDLANLWLQNGDSEKAQNYLRKAIVIAEDIHLLKHLKRAYQLESKLFASIGDFENAYKSDQKVDQISSQMGESKIASNLSRLERYTTQLREQSERKILLKEQEIMKLASKQEQLLRYIIISVAIIAALFAAYFIRQFTRSKKQAKKFEYQSKIDPLTGVWNRRAGEAQLQRLCNRDIYSVRVFSIAMLDIDFFKRVNDKYGHGVGDKVIVSVCNIIQDCLRPTDMLCRWGGEEFVLILERFDAEKSAEICERIRSKIANTEVPPVGNLTASLGIAMFENDELYELIKRGDQAMYDAKHLGRNRVVVKYKSQQDSLNKLANVPAE